MAPFDLSLIFLVVGTVVIALTWSENFGDREVNMSSTVSTALNRLFLDRKIWLLGIVQSCFEGSMYIFVFMWTPALENTTGSNILHGWIFATFMIAVLIGSTLFSYFLSQNQKVEKITCYLLLVAAISLFIPALSQYHSLRLFAFLVFEICCGIYWPCMGTMRGKYVPEEVRGTIMNLFRVPLNLIVVVVLLRIGEMSERSVFCLCAFFLCGGLLAQLVLVRLSVESPAAEKKENEEELDNGLLDDVTELQVELTAQGSDESSNNMTKAFAEVAQE